MSVRIFVSHSASDNDLASLLVETLQAMIASAEVGRSSLPAHVPSGGLDSFAALKQQLTDADTVVGLITAQSLVSGEVPFQLGAAWALGKRIVLMLDQSGSDVELYLPMGHAEALVLGPEALLEFSASIAASAGLPVQMSPLAREALAQLFPAWQGLDRESSERPIAYAQRDSSSTQPLWPVGEDPQSSDTQVTVRPGVAGAAKARARRASLPTCSGCVQAGRALSDCVFHRVEGGPFADELELPFGAFLAALGGNWSLLRELEDLDVWLEAADNVFGALGPTEQHVRYWYEVGFQLATLVNLAGSELDGSAPEGAELDALWDGAWRAFRGAAQAVAVEPAVLEELDGMLDNLRGPQAERDYANLGRVQDRIRELAIRGDVIGRPVSASAPG
jgi:hypothetical protein